MERAVEISGMPGWVRPDPTGGSRTATWPAQLLTAPLFGALCPAPHTRLKGLTRRAVQRAVWAGLATLSPADLRTALFGDSDACSLSRDAWPSMPQEIKHIYRLTHMASDTWEKNSGLGPLLAALHAPFAPPPRAPQVGR